MELCSFCRAQWSRQKYNFKLNSRFYDCEKGQIKIDNRNIYKVSLKSLRQNISLVSQDVILFDDTVEANILYANPSASKNYLSL